jgi:hypothetical protein
VRITYIEYNLPPDDWSSEYVKIEDFAASFVDMTGWTLSDTANNVFTFPSFALNPRAYVRVWTKGGSNTATDLYWGRSQPVWNNDHDCAYLRNTQGQQVSQYCY